MAEEKIDFFFMGCWNNETDLYKHREQVIEMIKINSGKYNYGLILGDNIYSTKYSDINKMKTKAVETGKGKSKRNKSKKNKSKKNKSKKKKSKTGGASKEMVLPYSVGFSGKKKQKPYTIKTFQYLIDFMNGMIPIETHLILGNHDIDYCEDSGKPAHLIKKLYDLIIKKKNPLKIEDSTIVGTNSYYHLTNKIIKVEKNYVLIALDTNKTQNTILKAFIDLILTEILKEKDFNKWIIFSGHEPLASIKQKNKKTKVNRTQNLRNITGIYNVLSKHNYRKMIHLCADTHNFQINQLYKCEEGHRDFTPQNIAEVANSPNNNSPDNNSPENNISIPIIVSGTGGAEIDKLEITRKPYIHTLRSNETLCVRNDGIFHSPFGYSDININESELTIRYISLEDEKIYLYKIINENNKTNCTIDILGPEALTSIPKLLITDITKEPTAVELLCK
jgi:hypothetical protein